MANPVPYSGEILSLLTAFTWAVAVILFKKSGEKVHPLSLALFKNTLGIALFFATMALAGKPLAISLSVRDQALLLASGALGIGIADTLFFSCLNRVGAGLSAIVSCLYSPFIIALSIPLLGESLTTLQALGAGMIVVAVATGACEGKACLTPQAGWVSGLVFGVVSMACTALGIVIIKPLLASAPLLWVTVVRLLGGEVVLLIGILLWPDRQALWASLYRAENRRYTLSSSFVGGYVSMILWLAGMKLTQASVASALNETSTIFIFLLSALFLREPITRWRMIGVTLGFLGALLVTFGT